MLLLFGINYQNNLAYGLAFWLFAIALVAAVPGIAAYRDTFRDNDQSTLTETALSLGRTSFGVWWHHLLPDALPGLLNWTLRNTGTVMLIFALLDFYRVNSQMDIVPGWGALMRIHADHVLDDPLPALIPAVMLALWSLSFRLLSQIGRAHV